MPRTSNTTGFACPRPGCLGKMGVRQCRPSVTGKIVIRIRRCRRCSLEIETREFSPAWEEVAARLHEIDRSAIAIATGLGAAENGSRGSTLRAD